MIRVDFDILLFGGKWERKNRSSLNENILMALRSTYLGEPESTKVEVLERSACSDSDESDSPRVIVHVTVVNEDCDAEAIVDLLHAAMLEHLCPQYESQIETEIICVREIEESCDD